MGLDLGDGYRMSEFSDQEKKLAKEFIAEALRSFVFMSADRQAEKFFKQLKNISFDGEDKFSFNFTIDTIGNDIITAIGAAKRKLEKQRGDSNHGEKRDFRHSSIRGD